MSAVNATNATHAPSQPRSPPPPSTPPTSIAASPCSQLRSPPPPSTPQRWRRVRRWRRQLGGGDRGCDGGGCAGLHNRFCHFLGPFSAPYLFVLVLDWAIAFCYEEFQISRACEMEVGESIGARSGIRPVHTHTHIARNGLLFEAEPVQSVTSCDGGTGYASNRSPSRCWWLRQPMHERCVNPLRFHIPYNPPVLYISDLVLGGPTPDLDLGFAQDLYRQTCDPRARRASRRCPSRH